MTLKSRFSDSLWFTPVTKLWQAFNDVAMPCHENRSWQMGAGSWANPPPSFPGRAVLLHRHSRQSTALPYLAMPAKSPGHRGCSDRIYRILQNSWGSSPVHPVMDSFAPAHSALAGLRLRQIPFADSQSAQVCPNHFRPAESVGINSRKPGAGSFQRWRSPGFSGMPGSSSNWIPVQAGRFV